MRLQAVFSAQNGTFLPKGCIFARNAAEKVFDVRADLASGAASSTVIDVVVAPPQWAKTQSLIRYPSPCRRTCAIWRRPPLFFVIAETYENERRLAHRTASRICDLEKAAPMALIGVTTSSHISKGTVACDQLPSGALPSSVFWASRPVVVPFPSRRSLAQVPGSAPRRCLTATLPQARLSGPRGTWLTAKPTHIAANRIASRRTPARTSSHRTIGAACAGGPFHVMPARACAGPRTERRDQPCSRRS